MGHPIPEPFCWDESFCVFYAQLDDEHKKIFQGIFSCAEANHQGNLDSLKNVVKNHFVYEEAEFAKVGMVLERITSFLLRELIVIYQSVIFSNVLGYRFIINLLPIDRWI